MNIVRGIIHLVLYAFFILLIARLVVDWIQVFARQWRPRGPVLVVAETVYTVTDPPLKALRKVVPPLRLGSIQLDLGFLILLIAVSVLLRVF